MKRVILIIIWAALAISAVPAHAALTQQPAQTLADNPTSDLSTFNDTSFWCQEFIKPVAQLDAVAYLKAHPDQKRNYTEMMSIGWRKPAQRQARADLSY